MLIQIMYLFVCMFLFVISCGFCFYCGLQVGKVKKAGKPKILMPKHKKKEEEEKLIDPVSQGIANIFAFDGVQKRK